MLQIYIKIASSIVNEPTKGARFPPPTMLHRIFELLCQVLVFLIPVKRLLLEINFISICCVGRAELQLSPLILLDSKEYLEYIFEIPKKISKELKVANGILIGNNN